MVTPELFMVAGSIWSSHSYLHRSIVFYANGGRERHIHGTYYCPTDVPYKTLLLLIKQPGSCSFAGLWPDQFVLRDNSSINSSLHTMDYGVSANPLEPINVSDTARAVCITRQKSKFALF